MDKIVRVRISTELYNVLHKTGNVSKAIRNVLQKEYNVGQIKKECPTKQVGQNDVGQKDNRKENVLHKHCKQCGHGMYVSYDGICSIHKEG